MSKSFWDWAGFFSRSVGGLLLVASLAGRFMDWTLPDAVAFGMLFSGLALFGFGIVANWIASEKSDTQD